MPLLVVDPELPYGELSARLRALGWEWRGESQALPTVTGEPESVTWGHAGNDTRLDYRFNPVVMLRVLSFAGPDADLERARTASFVPHLTPDTVAELVCSPEIESCLLGLLAAKELELATLLPLVLARASDADELIAEIASEVAEQLPRAVAPRWRAELSRRFERAGDANMSPLALLGDAALRRQIVRNAAATLEGDAAPALELVLRSALADHDWETRASALLWCGRLGMTAARDTIASLELPNDGRFGHGPRDLERIALLRRVVLDLLTDQRPPDDGLAGHAARCIRSGEDGQFDALFLLVLALTTPLTLEHVDPSCPAGVTATERGLTLARSGLIVARVSPLPAWLGDPEPSSAGAPNPLRRVIPRGGYFLSARPLSCALVRWVRDGGRGPTGGAREDDARDFLATFDEARAIAASLAAIEAAIIELPSADQWELAARGPDARRYPWGNGLEPNPAWRASPWGLIGMTGGLPEWTRDANGEALACGGGSGACSERSERTRAQRLPIRVCVR